MSKSFIFDKILLFLTNNSKKKEMDKVRENIKREQELDKFNIEKSVIGTEAYYINQDIQKGMSQDEIIEKARSGVYKLTAENKKAGRVGQKYGEEKKSDTDKKLKGGALSSVDYQKAKSRPGFNKDEWKWNSDQQLYLKESTEKKEDIFKDKTEAELNKIAGHPNDPLSEHAKLELNKRNKSKGMEPRFSNSEIDKNKLSQEKDHFEAMQKYSQK